MEKGPMRQFVVLLVNIQWMYLKHHGRLGTRALAPNIT